MEERIMGENVTQNNNVANGKKKSKVKWIVIAVVAIIIIAAIANGGSGDSNDVKKVDSKSSTKTEAKKDNTPETTKEKTSFNVGETAEYKNIQITLEKVITSQGDDMFVKPDDGKEFVLCVFKIQNNSDEDMTISSIVSFEAYLDDASINQDFLGVQTKEGKKYNSLDGDIASGKKMEGVISYEVPKDWKKLEVNVKPDAWSSKKITFVAKNK
jgi:hypothetical protein